MVVISNFRGCNSFLTNPYQGEEERAMTKLRVNYDIWPDSKNKAGLHFLATKIIVTSACRLRFTILNSMTFFIQNLAPRKIDKIISRSAESRHLVRSKPTNTNYSRKRSYHSCQTIFSGSGSQPNQKRRVKRGKVIKLKLTRMKSVYLSSYAWDWYLESVELNNYWRNTYHSIGYALPVWQTFFRMQRVSRGVNLL